MECQTAFQGKCTIYVLSPCVQGFESLYIPQDPLLKVELHLFNLHVDVIAGDVEHLF